MAQTSNPKQIHTLSFSEDDLLPIISFDFSKLGFLKSALHSSLLAIWKLSQNNMVSIPCHKLLTLTFKGGANMQGLTAISPKSIKSILTQVVTTTVLSNQTQHDAPQQYERTQFQKVYSSKCFLQFVRQQFKKILQKVLNNFRMQFNTKNPTTLIQFQWNQKQCLQIFQANYSQVKKCMNNNQMRGITKRELNHQNGQPHQGKQLVQFKQMLSKLSGNIKIKLDLYKLFQTNISSLKSKEHQIQQWVKCSHQLKETIKSQMDWIEMQQVENTNLHSIVQDLRKQLKINEDRLIAVQKQVSELQIQLAEFKVPQTQTYYINPYYEKAQLQQKMYMEIIEIEAELILGKEQIKLMTDSIIELVRICQNSFQDLQISKYFTSKFNRSAFTILKEIKSLQGFDLQGILNMKQQSIYDSEFFEQRRKSLSNFSELDIKESRILTEDDSLSGEQ